MNMNNSNSRELTRKTIRRTILRMERPFNVVDLFYTLEKDHDIQDRKLILDILDEMCESGVISYSEIYDDCWAFAVVAGATA